MEIKIVPLGDLAVQILFNGPITEMLNQRIRSISDRISGKKIKGIIENVPAIQTITVYYNPIEISFIELTRLLTETCYFESSKDTFSTKEIVTIPVCYGTEYGEDLKNVANQHHMTEEEVVYLHSKRTYLVNMIGFLPGFPYLSGLPDKLSTPRLSVPRLRVKKGSVGIGGSQTGIYPIESPGGWNIIGQTPISLFDPLKLDPFLLKAGDYIKFQPISSETFYKIKENRSYQVKREVISDEND